MASIKKAPKMALIALIITAIALATTTAAVITVNQNVASSGSITTTPNIGVYSDIACTQSMSTITWGTISAGGSATQTVYVKNTGTGSMTLSLSASSWSPTTASDYITVSWNRQGTTLSAGQSIEATVTIAVSSGITGITSFSNSLTFAGTG